jgi:hypothetical protein
MNGIAQQSVKPKSRLVKEILKTYRKLFEFDNTYDGLKEDIGDSVDRYNRALILLISAPAFGLLKDSDYKSISKSTGLIIQFSQDKKILLVSWRVLVNLPHQSCFNILWITGKATSVSSMKADSDNQFENSVQVDNIIDFNLGGKTYYILTGSNRCGILCIQEMISSFNIGNHGKLDLASIFYDGKKYNQELGFDYVLNEEIKGEPEFLINGDGLTCPLFNEHRTKVVGSKRYIIRSAGSAK